MYILNLYNTYDIAGDIALIRNKKYTLYDCSLGENKEIGGSELYDLAISGQLYGIRPFGTKRSDIRLHYVFKDIIGKMLDLKHCIIYISYDNYDLWYKGVYYKITNKSCSGINSIVLHKGVMKIDSITKGGIHVKIRVNAKPPKKLGGVLGLEMDKGTFMRGCLMSGDKEKGILW